MGKKPGLTITELFMAKADWGRCFHGTIHRWKDELGNPFVTSKITMHDGFHVVNGEWIRDNKPNITGYIYARAKDQWELGVQLDDIVLLRLDYNLHAAPAKVSNIGSVIAFLN